MRVLVTTEQRFWQCGGHTYIVGVARYDFWKRYLHDFDEVVVVARAMPVDRVEPEWQQVDGDRVTVSALPYYIGPWQYARRYRELRRAAQSAVRPDDAVIMRVPSPVSMRLFPWLRRTGRPFGLEVVGDPYDVFSPGAVVHPLAPVFRFILPRQLKQECAAAAAVAYVTRHALQRRYPAGPGAFSTFCSDSDLPAEAFVEQPRAAAAPKSSATLVSVTSLAQMYKAPDVLIKAVAKLIGAGRDLRLVIVGDGRHRPELEALAASLGVGPRVVFTGKLGGGKPVRDELDRADLFVLPSRTEGLPRALVEAMARGMPCIGSTVGGFPELLPLEDLVPPGEVDALADRIAAVLDDPGRLTRMAARNLLTAADYRDEVLRARRSEFYQELRRRTAEFYRGRD